MSDDKKKPYGVKDVAIDAILGRIEFVTPEVRAERLKICDGCPFLNKKLMKCEACGCFVKAKTKFKESSCPKGKW